MPYFTGVGSRETPANVLVLMETFARVATNQGYKLRSGGALGKRDKTGRVPTPNQSADEAFRRGAIAASRFEHVGMEIYLPWPGFDNWRADGKNYIAAPWLPNYAQAAEIASQVHPVYHKLPQGSQKLHTRNVYQVLGAHLNEPSDVCLFWAEPVGKSTMVRGGTNTAVQLAHRYGVPALNLFFDEVRAKVEGWLNGQFPTSFKQ